MPLLIAILLVGCSGGSLGDSEDFIVHAFKVGKADSILLTQGDKAILIDAGEEDDGDDIADYLKEHGINQLQALIITHFDKDHVGGADAVIRELDIEHVYVPSYENDGKQTKEFFEALYEKGIESEVVRETLAMELGSAAGSIYPPLSTTFSGDNDYSLIVDFKFRETSYLFAGDAEAPRLEEFLQKQASGETYTFLKVPHHGRYNDMTEAFVEAIQPSYAVICSSDKNPEEEETVEALEKAGAKVSTTRSGDVVFVSDGKKITMK